jgi:predicted nucleotidyltransferase
LANGGPTLMGRLSIDHVKPGMVLGKDAHTFRKQLLLPTGTVLNSKNIELMKAWGVSEVDSQGCAEPSLADVETRLQQVPALAAASLALDNRFSDMRDDATMMEILTIVKKQLLEEHR